MSNVILRDYQQEIYDKIHNIWSKSPDKNILAVLSTGAGKSVIISKVVENAVFNDEGVCVIAHRQELVSQMSLHLARDGITHNVIANVNVYKHIQQLHYKEYGRSFLNHRSKVAVAGIDTLIRREQRLKSWLPNVKLWVVDEGHHLLKENKWGRGVSMFPNARGLSVTATPIRLDGKALGSATTGLIDEMVVGVSMRYLINNGYLSDYKVFAPVVKNFDINNIKTTASGEYSRHDIERAVKNSSLYISDKSAMVGDVVTHYKNYANDTLAVVFVPSVNIGDVITNQFNKIGVPAKMLTAKNTDAERNKAILEFREGKIKVLLNVALFDEGFDLPAIETVIMASPTMSYARYSQQFGRALRPMPGKTHAKILDLVGNVIKHGLPDREHNWTLYPDKTKKNKKKTAINPLKTCDKCAYVYERTKHKCCPGCGYKPEIAERTIEQVDGDLTELDEKTLALLRGEVMKTVDDKVKDFIANMRHHTNPIYNQANIKRYRQRVERDASACEKLKNDMATWAGYRRYVDGMSDDQIFREFYVLTGYDWLSAQTLNFDNSNKIREILNNDQIR